MAAEQITPSLFIEVEIVGPGGTPAGDVTAIGWEALPTPPKVSGVVGADLNVGLRVKNDNPSQAYRAVDAILERTAGEATLSNVTATGSIAANLESVVTLTLVPNAAVRGTKGGTYKVTLVVDV